MKSNGGSSCDNHSSPLFLILIVCFHVIKILVGIILIGVIFFFFTKNLQWFSLGEFRHHLYWFYCTILGIINLLISLHNQSIKKSCAQVPQAIHQRTSLYFQDGFLNRVGSGFSHSPPLIHDLVKKDAACMLVSWCDHLTLSVTLDPGP